MKPARNGIVSLYKLIAACAVVFIHFPFPGTFGKWVDCLARFAVPLFFAISGYYAYRVDAGRLMKRLKKLIALAAAGYGSYFLWECFCRSVIQHKSTGGYVSHLLKVETLSAMLFMEEDPLYGHLWYLTAMVVVYIVYILYTRFWKEPGDIDYTPLYCVAACGFMFQIAFGMKLAGAGLATDKLIYRNSLYLGIPMFALGLFLNQYRDRLLERYGFSGTRAALLIVVGFALSLLQWFGIKRTAMPVGMLLVVYSLLLLANSGPDGAAPGRGAAMLCRWAEISSTVIYLFHPLVEMLISRAGKGIGFLDALRSRQTLYPLVILFASMALGVLVSIAREILRKKSARN